jgi:hypothetical protein
MKTAFIALALTLTTGVGFAGQQSRTFTGVISDSMCLRDHTAMKVSPVSKCVNDCVKASKDIRYSLIAGKNAYTLSDREKPARFAGQKVSVKGVLQAKTNVIEVESIEPAR